MLLELFCDLMGCIANLSDAGRVPTVLETGGLLTLFIAEVRGCSQVEIETSIPDLFSVVVVGPCQLRPLIQLHLPKP